MFFLFDLEPRAVVKDRTRSRPLRMGVEEEGQRKGMVTVDVSAAQVACEFTRPISIGIEVNAVQIIEIPITATWRRIPVLQERTLYG